MKKDKADEKRRLERFKAMPRLLRLLYARWRTFASVGFGIFAIVLLPNSLRLVTRLLIGWDVFVASYLVLAFAVMWRNESSARIRRNAALEDDGRFLILLITAMGAFASVAAIVSELATKESGSTALAISTIALTWAVVHTTFALHYAHDYYRDDGSPGGLQFPQDDRRKVEEPDYWDFVYFSLVIGMTFQVSDVDITDRVIRRTVTAHGVVSFVYNTALIALMVNIAASAI